MSLMPFKRLSASRRPEVTPRGRSTWLNREWTGYAPWKAAAESLMIPDPYFSESGEAPVFFAFGYEQQAAIVEDYVCFVAAPEPRAPLGVARAFRANFPGGSLR